MKDDADDKMEKPREDETYVSENIHAKRNDFLLQTANPIYQYIKIE